MNARLLHDCALLMGNECADMLDGFLKEEEKIRAREEFYHVCKAGISTYLEMAERLNQRLQPLGAVKGLQ